MKHIIFSPSKVDFDDFIRIDDITFYYHLIRWKDESFEPLSTLCKMFIDRNLLKAPDISFLSKVNRLKILAFASKLCEKYGYDSEIFCGIKERSFKGFESNNALKIWDGTNQSALENSSALIKTLKRSEESSFIIYPDMIKNEIKNDNKYKNQDSVLKFTRPVNGEILRKYNPTSVSNKNEGIDFAAEEGTPIKSAAAGVVALISEPVGGLGKIILIKHKDSIISIYGRVKDIKVAKGDRIIPGQVIGSVEKSSIDEEKQNYLHFELRKGTESLDPEPLFQ